MPIFSRNKRNSSNATDTDSAAWGAAKSNEIVRTIAPVKGFQAVSTREIEQMQKQVKERLEASKRFDQWLKLHSQWEQIDANDTKALLSYKSELAKVLVEKQAALAARDIAVEGLRVPQAKMQQGIVDARTKADQAIADLRAKQNQVADRNGWGRK